MPLGPPLSPLTPPSLPSISVELTALLLQVSCREGERARQEDELKEDDKGMGSDGERCPQCESLKLYNECWSLWDRVTETLFVPAENKSSHTMQR